MKNDIIEILEIHQEFLKNNVINFYDPYQFKQFERSVEILKNLKKQNDEKIKPEDLNW